MATVLDKEIKRELVLDDRPYTVTISPEGVKIVEKGRRLGREMTWRDLLSGDAELASQLLRSVSAAEKPRAVRAEEKAQPSTKSAARRRRGEEKRRG